MSIFLNGNSAFIYNVCNGERTISKFLNLCCPIFMIYVNKICSIQFNQLFFYQMDMQPIISIKNVNNVSVYTLNSLNKLFVLFFIFWFCFNTEKEKMEELIKHYQSSNILNPPPPPPELPISRVDGSRHVRSCRSNGPLLFYFWLTCGSSLILVLVDSLAFTLELSFHCKHVRVKCSLICSFSFFFVIILILWTYIIALKITQQTCTSSARTYSLNVW